MQGDMFLRSTDRLSRIEQTIWIPWLLDISFAVQISHSFGIFSLLLIYICSAWEPSPFCLMLICRGLWVKRKTYLNWSLSRDWIVSGESKALRCACMSWSATLSRGKSSVDTFQLRFINRHLRSGATGILLSRPVEVLFTRHKSQSTRRKMRTWESKHNQRETRARMFRWLAELGFSTQSVSISDASEQDWSAHYINSPNQDDA